MASALSSATPLWINHHSSILHHHNPSISIYFHLKYRNVKDWNIQKNLFSNNWNMSVMNWMSSTSPLWPQPWPLVWRRSWGHYPYTMASSNPMMKKNLTLPSFSCPLPSLSCLNCHPLVLHLISWANSCFSGSGLSSLRQKQPPMVTSYPQNCFQPSKTVKNLLLWFKVHHRRQKFWFFSTH